MTRDNQDCKVLLSWWRQHPVQWCKLLLSLFWCVSSSIGSAQTCMWEWMNAGKRKQCAASPFRLDRWLSLYFSVPIYYRGFWLRHLGGFSRYLIHWKTKPIILSIGPSNSNPVRAPCTHNDERNASLPLRHCEKKAQVIIKCRQRVSHTIAALGTYLSIVLLRHPTLSFLNLLRSHFLFPG